MELFTSFPKKEGQSETVKKPVVRFAYPQAPLTIKVNSEIKKPDKHLVISTKSSTSKEPSLLINIKKSGNPTLIMAPVRLVQDFVVPMRDGQLPIHFHRVNQFPKVAFPLGSRSTQDYIQRARQLPEALSSIYSPIAHKIIK